MVAENLEEQPNDQEQRIYLTTLLLSLFLGFLGADRFYLGKIGTAILKFFTFGGLGIWSAIDIYRVVRGQVHDVNGNKLEGVELRDPVFITLLSLVGLDRIFLGDTILGIVKWLSPVLMWILLAIAISSGSTFGTVLLSIIILAYLSWHVLDIYKSIKGERIDKENRLIQTAEKRYQSVALLLSMFTGFLALDRFYLGHKSVGILKILTSIYLFWIYLDIILILLNSIKDINDEKLIQS